MIPRVACVRETLETKIPGGEIRAIRAINRVHRQIARTVYIQHLDSARGSAPATGCAPSADIGKKAFIAYAADYFLYTDQSDH